MTIFLISYKGRYYIVILLTVDDDSRIRPIKQLAKPGSSANIYCKTSIPAEWYFNGSNLPYNAYPIRKIKDVLHIDQVTYKNSGLYECVGTTHQSQKYFIAGSLLRVVGEHSIHY